MEMSKKDLKDLYLPDLGKVNIWDPHGDDGVLGMSATAYDLCGLGSEVHYIVVTDGSDGCVDLRQRQSEIHKACEILGIHKVRYLNLPDQNLKSVKYWEDGKSGGYSIFCRVLRETRPDTVFIATPSDPHVDHGDTEDIFRQGFLQAHEDLEKARVFGKPIDIPRVFYYAVREGLGNIHPYIPIPRATHFHRISDEARRAKEEALSEFESQRQIIEGIDTDPEIEFFELADMTRRAVLL
jgi:LmbE family N-acetylglucosaminyl deacetylase